MKKSFTSTGHLDTVGNTDLKKKFGSGTPKYTFGISNKKESFIDYMNPSAPSRSRDLRNQPGPGQYSSHNINLERNKSQWR